MTEIAAWLNSSRDYISGVKLYEKYGSNAVLKTVLVKSDTSFNRNKLLQELSKINNAAALVKQEKKTEKITGIYVEENFDALPDVIKELVFNAKQIYKEIGALHSRVFTHIENALQLNDIREQQKYLDSKEVGDLVHTILDLDEQREELIRQIDYFKEYKKLPAENKPLDQTILEITEGAIRVRLSQLRPQISKQKNNPLRAYDVLAWNQEKELLERRLDELV